MNWFWNELGKDLSRSLGDRNARRVGFQHPSRERASHHQIVTGMALGANHVACANPMTLCTRTTVGAVNRFYGQHCGHHLAKI